jgi:cell division protein FtsL
MTPPAAATASAAPARTPSRRRAPAPRPRRVSGPVRRPQTRPAQPPAQSGEGLLLGLLRGAETLSGHRALDRLIRGRLWIGLVTFALIGIVTLQLGLLKLNSGIGKAIEREASLQTSNSALSIENSELAAGNRVEQQAAKLGMTLVPISSIKFLASHAKSDVPAAAAALRQAPQSAPHETAPVAETPDQTQPQEQTASSPASSETEPAAADTGEASSSSGETASAESDSGAAGSEAPVSAPTTDEAGGGTAAPAG